MKKKKKRKANKRINRILLLAAIPFAYGGQIRRLAAAVKGNLQRLKTKEN